MGRVSRPSDAELARMAGRWRVLTIEQLRAAGLSTEAIGHRVRTGRLQRWCTGVYLVGPAAPHPLSHALAAVKSCRDAAWASHGWAAYVLGFGPVPELPVDVTVVRGSRDGKPGKVKVHRGDLLEPRDVTSRHGIPVTTAARAILDIADGATIIELEALKADAEVANMLTEARLHDVLDRAGRRRGAPKVRRLMAETAGLTRSEAERMLRRLLKAAELPQPLTGYRIGTYEADFAWPQAKLVVEFDSFKYHGHRSAFRRDRKRATDITANGWSVMPLTWDQLKNEPLALVANISRAIALRSA